MKAQPVCGALTMAIWQKHGVSSSQAMELLFDGKLPDFSYQK